MSERPSMAGHGETGHGNRHPSLQLVTFGGPVLIVGTVTLSLSPQRGALLGLLATEPDDGVSTARVIDLLWERGLSSRLRHRNSQLIYSLNREFPEQLVVKRRHHLYLSKAIATDYRAPVRAISNNRLMEAAELLKLGFLSELTKPPSNAFSEWLDNTRLELRARLRHAAAEQWTRLTAQARWKRAVEPARALLSLNPYDEPALRMLIRAEAMAGSVREAEAAFHSFVERSESGNRDWVPQTETLSLVDDIRSLPPRARRVVSVQAPEKPPLIGRSRELAALSAAMFQQPGEGLRVTVIRGERGTGKTRLVEESLMTAVRKGIRILHCRASMAGRRYFLNSVLEALTSSDIGPDLRSLAEPWRAIVLDLLTERRIRTHPPYGPPAAASHPVDQRYIEALGRLLVLLAGNEPTILFIDDFQWVDEDSAAVLRHLAQRRPTPPLAVTLAVETESVREGDPAGRLLGDSVLQRGPEGSTEFSLGELSREAAAELVDTIADGRIEEGVRDRIVELSDRNPLFLLELAELCLAGRRLPNLDPDDFVPVPRSISDVFSDRLAELDDNAESTLQLLSVLGRPLRVGRLSELTDRARDSCVEALDQLQQSRLARRGPSGVAVRHQLLRHVVYDQMRVARRTWAHGCVAVHLEDAKTTVPPAELVTHYHHAGMPVQAFRHALAGATVAERSGALAEATRLFTLARRNIHNPRVHALMAERLAHLHYVRRDTDNGPARLAEAASQLRKVQHLPNALVAEMQRVDLLAGGGSCSSQEAVVRIRELGHAAEQARLWIAAARAIDLELHIHRREGRGREAEALAAHARKLLDQVEPGSRGPLHACLALHHQGDLDAGLEHAREAVALARHNRAPDDLLRALVRLVAIQGVRGLIAGAEAVSALEEGETLAGPGVDFAECFNLLATVGTGYRAIGHLDQASTWFARAGRVLANVKTWESHVSLECKLGALALEEREPDRAAAHFARARQLWTPGMGRSLGIISHSGLGLAARRSGDMQLAREMADHISEPPASWFEDPWVYALFTAHLCAWRGVVGEGVDAVGEIAGRIETSQPAHWARLKFEEALLRLRHSLPQRDEVAKTAADAAARLGIDRRIALLRAARRRVR